MKDIMKSAETVDEAIRAGLEDLETTEDQVDIEILEEPKKGLFGLGMKSAVVRLQKKSGPVDLAEAFLQNVITDMGLQVTIDIVDQTDYVLFELQTDQAALLIGKRGNTLNALQYLTNLAANHQNEDHIYVVLDTEGYRAKRKETLQQLAYRMSRKAVSLGREVRLDPMPSMERKIIHTALQSEDDVQTSSLGQDPHRKVVITPQVTSAD